MKANYFHFFLIFIFCRIFLLFNDVILLCYWYIVFLIENFIFFRLLAAFRLKVDNNGGAWCPKHIVSRGLKEFLQIDLLQMHAITGIRSQGRFGRGQGQEYTEAYVVEYWRPGFAKWERWKNTQNKEVR